MALWGSLQVKFGLSYIAVIAAVLLLLNTYPLLVSEDLVFRSKETNMTGSVSVVVYSLAGLNRLNQENVAAAMAVVEETGLSRVLVTDSTGLVLYDTRETGSAVGKYTFYSEIVQALEGYDAFSCSYRDGAFRSRTASPVLYQNRIIGAVYAYEYDTEQATLLEGLQSNLLKLSAGIAAAVVLLSILLSRMLTRKISTLLTAIRKVRAGAYEHRTHISGRDEIAQIGEEFNSLTDRLQTTETLRRRFVSDASHELRTPLAAIHGYAELYKMQRDMPGALERADESIEHIERSSQRMTVLVEDLLSLARLDEGRGIDMTGTVKLSSLVTDAVDDLHALDPDRAVRRMQISLEPARDLNHPAEFSLAEGDWPEVVLPGDASRLRQVVTNIVGNIHRYTPADSPAEAALGVMPAAIDPRQLARMPASDASMRRFIDAAEVGASMQTGYRYAVLRFVDHGPGVPPESRSKIFERFYTADPSRAREKGGTGLGMAIAQSVVKAHHGFICATGTDGGGLTFTVVLPIEQIAAPEPKQSTGKTKDAKQKTSWFSSERKTQATQPKA